MCAGPGSRLTFHFSTPLQTSSSSERAFLCAKENVTHLHPPSLSILFIRSPSPHTHEARTKSPKMGAQDRSGRNLGRRRRCLSSFPLILLSVSSLLSGSAFFGDSEALFQLPRKGSFDTSTTTAGDRLARLAEKEIRQESYFCRKLHALRYKSKTTTTSADKNSS